MGRKVAVLWHASCSIAAGALYFFFVLPRWPELMGETTRTLGIALRIVAGVLISVAALPVTFTLLRTRKPEFGTPQLALKLLTGSVIAQATAGALIIGTAISEIWFTLNTAGQWLFGSYAAAAAVALLGFFAFYLSFIAELPPPPPKPLKPKSTTRRGIGLRRKKTDEQKESATADGAESAADAATAAPQSAAEEDQPDPLEDAADPTDEAPQRGLRNQRPTGKGKMSQRRGNASSTVVVED
ncbi:MAG: hypothetical protein K2Q25_00785 [Mycobacteriaceae bacterium]|nr:hypothetical protein [Mycobacteriaceae bacterium]